MDTPYLLFSQTEEGFQVIFAFQAFHRQSDEWLKMRWGFNAGVLLEEALDRLKLFVESLAINEAEFHMGWQVDHVLALRGINHPGTGMQISLIGKVKAQSMEDASSTSLNFARAIYSTFPQDFILTPATQLDDFNRLCGEDILSVDSKIAQVQRGMLSILLATGRKFFYGLWQASQRSNEQIWRALSSTQDEVLFNIQIQPTFFYEGEKLSLLETKKNLSASGQPADLSLAYIPWIENYIKRRLTPWKKFFLIQIHVVSRGILDERLLRSIGSALTRDTSEVSLPGFQIKRPTSFSEGQDWRKKILSLDMVAESRNEDLADSDEAFAVFRIPYINEGGLPGANFTGMQQDLSTIDTKGE